MKVGSKFSGVKRDCGTFGFKTDSVVYKQVSVDLIGKIVNNQNYGK